jgi:hypothetical protein
MNIKPIATLLTLSTILLVPAVASAITPQQAAAASWRMRTTTPHGQQPAYTNHDLMYLSDPHHSGSAFSFYSGDHRGLTQVQDQVVSGTSAGEWIIADGLYMHVEVHETHTWPYVRFGAAQFGVYDGVCSVAEGVDLRIGGTVFVPTRNAQGLFNMAQTQSVAQPSAGTPVSMQGCWSMTTTWCDFDQNTLSCSYNYPVTHNWIFNANGTAQSTGTGETSTYAAVENASGDEQLVLVFGNGRAVGGLLSVDGQGIRQIDPSDGIGFAPRLSLNGQMIPALTSAYDTNNQDDPRLGTFSLRYVGPSC